MNFPMRRPVSSLLAAAVAVALCGAAAGAGGCAKNETAQQADMKAKFQGGNTPPGFYERLAKERAAAMAGGRPGTTPVKPGGVVGNAGGMAASAAVPAAPPKQNPPARP